MRAFVAVLTAVLLVCMGLVVLAQAEVVGRMTQVEGRVDFLKGGKLPAAEAKLNDGVEVGDVLRTKSLSKAQITFMDNSVITVSPESRIAVEEYMFDPGKGKRSAVLQLFQGLANVVVSKLSKVSEPDFVVKTQTAVLGVRGTEFGVRLHPNSSTILNFEGHTEVANIFPEVGDLLFKKAYKIAFSWGGPASVQLGNMQGTTVFRGLPPTQPFSISQQDRQQFVGQMGSGLTGQRGKGGGTSGSGGGSGSGSSGSSSGSTSSSASLGGADSGLGTTVPSTTTLGNTTLATLNLVTIPPSGPGGTPNPPPPPPPPPPPTPGTYNLSATTYSQFNVTATSSSTYTATSSGWASGEGNWTTSPLYYTSSSTADRTISAGSNITGSATGTSTGTLSGTVTGILGSAPLTGTGTYSGTDSYGNSTKYTGNITVAPSGQLTFSYTNGTLSGQTQVASSTGSITYTPGTYFTQTMNGAILRTSDPPYNTSGSTTTGTGLWAGGSRTGVLPGDFSLSFTGTETSPWTFSYQPNELGDLPANIQGVVSPGSGGSLQGALTIFPVNPDTPFASSLVSPLQPSSYLFPRAWTNETIVSSINIQPSGSATGTGYDTYFQDGKFVSSTFNLSQTPQAGPVTPTSATYNFTQTYNGAYMVNNTGMTPVSAGNTGVGSFGWGQRSGTGTPGTEVYGGTGTGTGGTGPYTYFAANDNGVWNGTSSPQSPFTSYLPANYNGSSLTTGTTGPGSVTQMSGSVAGTLGQKLTGSMTWIGSLINGPSFSYSGPVTMSSDGSLKFTYGNGTYANGGSYASNWTFGSSSGTASGTLWQNQGYPFTQTMTGTGNYQVSLSNPSNGTLTLSNSSTTTGSRSGVYGGNIGPFSGTFNLFTSDSNPLPTSLSGLSGTGVSLTLDGVAYNSTLGATSGPATLQINSADGLSWMTVPGMVGLSPGNAGLAGGTYFTAPGVLVQNSTGTPFGVGSFTSSSTLPTPLAQTPLYYFTESYQGFRLSSLGASPNLANVEGYGFGLATSTGTIPTGATALPANTANYSYLGAFLAQDLGTRASTTPLSSNMLSLTGNLSATLSGALGKPLTGQGLFTGTNSAGIQFSYQGNVTLAANGQLVFNYGGTWNNPTTLQTGTGSGTIQQIPGTLFSETVTGTYQQASTSTPLGTNYPTGTNLTVVTVKDETPIVSTRTLGSTTTPITGSSAAMLAVTTTNPPDSTTTPIPGTGSVTLQGVVAASSPQTQWGVATSTATFTPSGGSQSTLPGTTGVVTIDPSGTLTGQFVNTISSGTSTPNPANNLSVNYVSVPTNAGLATASFTQTASGTYNAAASNINNNTQSVVTITSPTLTGTSTGVLAGNINANLNITSTALQPNAYTSGSGNIATTTVGVVAGPIGGAQTGVSTVQAVKTATTGTTTPTAYVGTTTLTPAVGAAVSPTLTTILQGVNPASVSGGPVGATQTGTLTVTK